MLIYLYDGSLQSLLTIIYDCVKDNIIPDKITNENNKENELFGEYILKNCDDKKAQTVLNYLKSNFSIKIIENIFYAFLSNEKEIELKILNYVYEIMKRKKDISNNFTDNNVFVIKKIILNVKNEVHRYLGIVRFSETKDNTYYAEIEPDNNIICLISNHFIRRFKNQNFLIHDIKRNIGAFYYNGNIEYMELNSKIDMDEILSEDEKIYQSLWKIYFKNIAISERKNLRLQRQFIPQRYWKYLTEKQQ